MTGSCSIPPTKRRAHREGRKSPLLTNTGLLPFPISLPFSGKTILNKCAKHNFRFPQPTLWQLYSVPVISAQNYNKIDHFTTDFNTLYARVKLCETHRENTFTKIVFKFDLISKKYVNNFKII